MERIEEEVGLELHPQHLILSLGEAGLQLGGVELARFEAPIHVHRREGAHGDEEIHERQVEVSPEEVREMTAEHLPWRERRPSQHEVDAEGRGKTHDREDQAHD